MTFLNSHDRLYGLLYVINNANESHRTPSSGYRLDCSSKGHFKKKMLYKFMISSCKLI